jgi:hypothetical protein
MLDESKLRYTLPIDKEAIVNDKDTKAPIAIILRDFAKDYYDNLIRPWSTELVTRSLSVAVTMSYATTPDGWPGPASALDKGVGPYLAGYGISGGAQDSTWI